MNADLRDLAVLLETETRSRDVILISLKKVQVGNDQEKALSTPKNRGGKKLE